MDEFYIFIHNGDYVTVSGDYNYDPDIVANLGETWEDYLNGKYILLNKEQEAYLNTNPSATPKEAYDMQEDKSASESDISSLISKITDYGNSEAVKTFYINDVPLWYDSENRTSISSSIRMEKEVGKDYTTLWVGNTPYKLTIDSALDMFKKIELYSKACYNATQTNIVKAESLTLKSDVRTFDITKGYPEKLKFNI